MDTKPSPWEVKAIGGPARAPDDHEVRRAAPILFAPGQAVELRGLPSGRSRIVRVDPSDLGDLLAAVADLADDRGLYYTLNPVRPDLDRAARNNDVVERRWLFVDVDSTRADPEASATPAEKAEAHRVAVAVVAHLAELDWPDPVAIDSGNGFHLLYRVELPNDELAKVWVSAILKVLAAAHDAAGARIDTKVHNAARIAKLPGTWNQKGPNTAERPHRLCRILSAPDEVRTVSSEQLAALANHPAIRPEKAEDAAVRTAPVPWQVRAGRPSTRAAYVRSAVERELAKVALAVEGDRNNRLNEAAFSLGTLLWTGEVARADLEAQLEHAAHRAGLGGREVKSTIRSGLDAGTAKPRHWPELPGGQGRPPGGPDDGAPVVVRASSVRPKVVEWLWPGRIPYGFITVFAGRTGVGKSFVTCDVAARVTTGDDWPDSAGECVEAGNVLLISEDPFDYVLTPRLHELGADLSRVYFMSWEAMAQYTLDDTATLGRAVAEAGRPSLIVIDPPTNFLGGRDEHKNSEVRRTLMCLVAWLNAAERPTACILITHVNKSGGKGVEAINRVIGSVAWTTTARVAHSFSPDPEAAGRSLFVPMKSNLGALPKGLAFRIAKTEALARVEWLGEVETSADEAMDSGPAKKSDRADPAKAADWLKSFLQDGPKPSNDCVQSGNAALGIDKDLDWWRVRVFRSRLGGTPSKQGFGPSGPWVWALPPPSIEVNGVGLY